MEEIFNILTKYGTSLEETRKLYEELTPALAEKQAEQYLVGVPRYLTSEDIKELGITTDTGELLEIPEGWMMKVTPPTETVEPSLSFISPGGEELKPEDI